ncbi:MAG: chromate transporter [Heliobacteriaceae bacterium]|jgi:chromate transporter|nr:chromate transporter [Heliobacteriaceae bacterium]
MIFLKLFLEFFHIGLFSFGGGYATLPFLYRIAQIHDWYTVQQLSDLIGIASITPGPVGVNAATYAGFMTGGVAGAAIATVAVILPSFIIIIIVSRMLEKFRENKYVCSVIYVLKPAACGLLAAVGINMFMNNGYNFFGFLLLACLFASSLYDRKSPLFYLGISALVGLIAGFFNLTG